MIILGADLSYKRSGLVWVDEKFKVVDHIAKQFPAGPRRLYLAREFFEKHTINGDYYVDFCVIEDYAYGAPSRFVVSRLSELGGVFKSVLEQRPVPYLTIAPGMIKKQLTGNGWAKKEIVAQELERLYGIKFAKDPGYDLSDAAACAVWGVKHNQK